MNLIIDNLMFNRTFLGQFVLIVILMILQMNAQMPVCTCMAFLTGYAINPDLNNPRLSREWPHHQGGACWNKWPESRA